MEQLVNHIDSGTLKVEKKTGYRALGDVYITDAHGHGFYVAKAGEQFNMPHGTFGIRGEIEKLAAPLNYEIPFHPFQRSDREYNDVKTIICNNPHKASVLFENGVATIYLDKKVAALPLACVAYACSHELAHAHYYGDNPDELEMLCDEYAEHRLIDLGFNPSQIKAANKMLLSTGWRKDACNERMMKHFAK